jgi:predicted nucleic acid-binding Zn ribbon protein
VIIITKNERLEEIQPFLFKGSGFYANAEEGYSSRN